jgi:hypothetical protein
MGLWAGHRRRPVRVFVRSCLARGGACSNDGLRRAIFSLLVMFPSMPIARERHGHARLGRARLLRSRAPAGMTDVR